MSLRTDALLLRTASDEMGVVAGTEAAVSRLRLGAQSSYDLRLGDGSTLRPVLEVAARYDHGDAERGLGVELSGGVRYENAALGLSVEASGRGLLAHEDRGYREWGAAGRLALGPRAGGEGLSVSVAPSWGATAGRGEELWTRSNLAGLAGSEQAQPGGSLSAELGYGVKVLCAGCLATPYAALELAADGAHVLRCPAHTRMAVSHTEKFMSSTPITPKNNKKITLKDRRMVYAPR